MEHAPSVFIVRDVPLSEAEVRAKKSLLKVSGLRSMPCAVYVSKISGRTLIPEHLMLFAPDVVSCMDDGAFKKRFEELKRVRGFAEYIVDFMDTFENHLVPVLECFANTYRSGGVPPNRRVEVDMILWNVLTNFWTSDVHAKLCSGEIAERLNDVGDYIHYMLVGEAADPQRAPIGALHRLLNFYKSYTAIPGLSRSLAAQRLSRHPIGGAPVNDATPRIEINVLGRIYTCFKPKILLERALGATTPKIIAWSKCSDFNTLVNQGLSPDVFMRVIRFIKNIVFSDGDGNRYMFVSEIQLCSRCRAEESCLISECGHANLCADCAPKRVICCSICERPIRLLINPDN